MKIHFLFGTETGSAEMLCEDIRDDLGDGFTCAITSMGEVDPGDLDGETLYLFITSTYGNGDLPMVAQPFYDAIVERGLDLSHIRFGIFGQREIARVACGAQEAADVIGGKIGRRGITANAGVERGGAQQFVRLQIVHQGGVNGREQAGAVGKAAANQFIAGTGDERPHFCVFVVIVCAFDVNEPWLLQLGCALEFLFRGRDALRIFKAVVVAKQPQIDVAGGYFVQIHLIAAAVGRGQVFKYKNIKETPQQRVAAQVVAQRGTLMGKFLLYAADEDALHCVRRSGNTISCPVFSKSRRWRDGNSNLPYPHLGGDAGRARRCAEVAVEGVHDGGAAGGQV